MAHAPHINWQWPDSFDFESDDVCQTHFKPLIESALSDLKQLDEQRLALAPTNYIFHQHAPRVATLVKDIAMRLGASTAAANNLYWAALAHDLGKAHISDPRYDSTAHIWKEFADKPTDDIFDLRRTHGRVGADIIKDSVKNAPAARAHPFYTLMLDIAGNHHEYLDGTGPLGKKADQLSPIVRLTAIIEAFDGYCIKRAHFPADRDTSPAGAIAHMAKKTTQFDQDIFKIFSDYILSQKAAS